MAVRQQVFAIIQLGPKQSVTPEGFLLCEEVAVARTGMMIYGPDETPVEAGPDGIVKIHREEADVFRPETLASANGKPVVNDHPEDDVTPDNWKELTHGVMLNPRRGTGAMDDLLLADLLVTTPEGIEAIQSGKVEVSLGYDADYEEVSPGVGKQSNIIINHVALVEQGRCGSRCAIRDKKTIDVKENIMAKKSKVLDMFMRAFKAKDAAEVEKLAEEARDELGEMTSGTEGGDTHIHVHAGGKDDEPMAGESGRASFTDEDFQQHVDQNAQEHAEMRAEIAELREQLAALKGGSTGDNENPDGGVMDEENKEIEGQLKEEAPAGTSDEEVVKARDSAYLVDSFQDTVAMAEILVPGIKIPTFDRAAMPAQSFKKICNFRRQALDLAYVQPSTRSIVDDLLGGKVLDTKSMTCDAVRTVFRSAALAQRSANNAGKGRTGDAGATKAGPVTLAEINRRNAERYKN